MKGTTSALRIGCESGGAVLNPKLKPFGLLGGILVVVALVSAVAIFRAGASHGTINTVAIDLGFDVTNGDTRLLHGSLTVPAAVACPANADCGTLLKGFIPGGSLAARG